MHRYELELDYRPAGNALVGRALLTVETACDLTSLQLDLVGLKVDKVSVLGGDPVRWRQAGGRLTVRLPAVVPAGGRLVFDVRYSGKPGPQSGPWGEVGWEELTDGVLVAGEPDGAATWFPCNDLPAHKASFRITVKTDSAYTVLANGVLMQQHVGAGQTTWVYEQAEPMATYLATVQIGRYTAVSRDQRPVPHIVYAPAALADAVVEDTRRQAEMLTLFTELFGPYPFSSYAVVVTDDPLEIPLEAQSLSVFGANHLDGEGRNERLVAHELAHQWFGNSLTVASWKDIWLHEGFACYAEWLWSEGSGTRSAADQAETAWERLATEPQDLVVNDPGPDLMFDDRLYKRGALALHALRTHLGDDRFFELIQAWVSRHRHGSVSSEAFAQIAEEYGGKAATALLHDWVGRVQLPAFTR